MFRQKQTPRGNNSQKTVRQMLSKNHRRTPIQKSNPHRAAYATLLKSHPHPPLSRKSAAHSQNTLSEEHLRRATSVLIFNLEVRFCQKKLIKSKNSWDYLYLVIIISWLCLLKTFVYIIWQNFLRELTCIKEKELACIVCKHE